MSHGKRLRIMQIRDLESRLNAAGYERMPRRGRGHHRVCFCEKTGRLIVLTGEPWDEIPEGILEKILEQAGLLEEDDEE
ncbi:MAG: addiction module toxin, HicA family [Armatimonadia bacterium]|nr:addiction module toxin, HicA family [Armatimonadia bacterium]